MARLHMRVSIGMRVYLPALLVSSQLAGMSSRYPSLLLENVLDDGVPALACCATVAPSNSSDSAPRLPQGVAASVEQEKARSAIRLCRTARVGRLGIQRWKQRCEGSCLLIRTSIIGWARPFAKPDLPDRFQQKFCTLTSQVSGTLKASRRSV